MKEAAWCVNGDRQHEQDVTAAHAYVSLQLLRQPEFYKLSWIHHNQHQHHQSSAPDGWFDSPKLLNAHSQHYFRWGRLYLPFCYFCKFSVKRRTISESLSFSLCQRFFTSTVQLTYWNLVLHLHENKIMDSREGNHLNTKIWFTRCSFQV